MSKTPESQDESLAKIQDIIKEIRIAMLSSTGEDGRIYSRPMATQESRFQGELWFLTRKDSGKVDEIRHDSHVNVTYADTKNSTFVSLSGRADVNSDRSKIHELWNPLYKAWFPNGEEDPEIAVLRVVVEDAEYWDAPSNALARNYQVLKAVVTKGSSPVGEHAHVTLNRSA
jgi:general stress protein 26